MKYVYCSGPLFCPEEIAGMSTVARVMEEAGFGTFLPHRDGVERFVMPLVDSVLNTNLLGMREKIDRAIFSLDVYQIVSRCDYFVFNMNGRVPDEGAVAEAGIAFVVGKPVVLYKNDRRSVFKGSDNSMLLGLSVLKPVRDLRKLPGAVVEAEQRLERSGSNRPPFLSESLERAVRHGERVWKIVRHQPKGRTREKVILAMEEEMFTVGDLSDRKEP